MGLITMVERWVFNIAAKRAAAGVAGWVVGLVALPVVDAVLANMGVAVDLKQLQAYLTGTFVTATIVLHDWIRMTNLGKKLKL